MYPSESSNTRRLHLTTRLRLVCLCFCLCLCLCLPACQSAPPASSPTVSARGTTTATVLPTATVPLMATATATTTATPTATRERPSPTPVTPTATPTLTPTPLPWEQSEQIGLSVQGRPLTATRFGHGARWFVVIGALHGGHECSTADLVAYQMERIRAAPEWLPADVSLFMLPLANPDGCALDTRHNANDIDLNRNWETPDWTPDVFGPFGAEPGSGGSVPFSEPETAALRDWLLRLQTEASGAVTIIAYHAAVPPNGVTLPGYRAETGINPQAEGLAILYADLADYDYATGWVGNYTITGEFIHWADRQGFIAVDVELPDRNGIDYIPTGGFATHGEINLMALLSTTALFFAE